MRYATLLVLALTACGGSASDAVAPTPAAHVGIYALTAVNGQKPPYVLSNIAGNKNSISSGNFELRADGYFTETYVEVSENILRTTANTVSWFGTYTVSRGTLVLSYSFTSGRGVERGSVAGGVVTANEGPGLILAFAK